MKAGKTIPGLLSSKVPAETARPSAFEGLSTSMREISRAGNR